LSSPRVVLCPSPGDLRLSHDLEVTIEEIP
jgi:hypothetical protein